MSQVKDCKGVNRTDPGRWRVLGRFLCIFFILAYLGASYLVIIGKSVGVPLSIATFAFFVVGIGVEFLSEGPVKRFLFISVFCCLMGVSIFLLSILSKGVGGTYEVLQYLKALLGVGLVILGIVFYFFYTRKRKSINS